MERERKAQKLSEEKGLKLLFPCGKHIFLPDHCTQKCNTLKNMLLDAPDTEELQVGFTTFVVMGWMVQYLERNFVGFSLYSLVDIIKLGDYLDTNIDHLIRELMSRVNFYKPLDPVFAEKMKDRRFEFYHCVQDADDSHCVLSLPPGLVKKYILSQIPVDRLEKVRFFSKCWWNLVTQEMVERARANMPQSVAHLVGDQVLFETFYCYVPMVGMDYCEEVLLKHGSFHALDEYNNKKQARNEKRRLQRAANREAKLAAQRVAKDELNNLLLECCNISLDTLQILMQQVNHCYLLEAIQNWIKNLTPFDKEMIVNLYNASCEELVNQHEFSVLFKLVGKEKFKQYIKDF